MPDRDLYGASDRSYTIDRPRSDIGALREFGRDYYPSSPGATPTTPWMVKENQDRQDLYTEGLRRDIEGDYSSRQPGFGVGNLRTVRPPLNPFVNPRGMRKGIETLGPTGSSGQQSKINWLENINPFGWGNKLREKNEQLENHLNELYRQQDELRSAFSFEPGPWNEFDPSEKEKKYYDQVNEMYRQIDKGRMDPHTVGGQQPGPWNEFDPVGKFEELYEDERGTPWQPTEDYLSGKTQVAEVDPADWRTIIKILEAGGNPEDYYANRGGLMSFV